MDLTGPIFALIAVAWLAYLIPRFMRRREQRSPELSGAQPLAEGMRVIYSPVGSDEPIDADLEVSTPFTRRAALTQLDEAASRAARRRRRVLAVLGVLEVAALGAGALGRVPFAMALIPLVLIVAFLAVARVSVQKMHADLDRRAAAIVSTGWDMDDTQVFSFPLVEDEAERAVEISAPIPFVGSLWDPVPVTRATYVQKPLAPRTVRTIDLSAPQPVSDVPPTAEAPYVAGEEQYPSWGAYARPRAVGE